MGGTLSSCSFDDFETLFRSVSFEGRDAKSNLFRSMSFNGHDSEPAIAALRSYGSAKSVFERSLSLQRISSFKTPKKTTKNDKFGREIMPDNWDFQRGENPGKKERSHQAALRLQKVYKSFRTRRRLADCAVMVEQRWWKLLDFAELKRSSISFFDIEKPESAISRWSRARTRAAKVGKGLSKDEKARKLALQHWLEAIDPRHRYGHNLQFYYVKWLHCESKEPFFYWLDIGQGKELNLEICPRSKLHQQCIKYLGPTEREAYEVVIRDGKFEYVKSGKTIDTTGGPKDTKWIFVLSTSKALYVGMKSKGTFQHSSFLAGGATLSAGRLEVENGVLKAVWPHSGHYLPTEENFQEFMSFLVDNNVDLTNVKKSPSEDDDPISRKIKRSSTIRKNTLSQPEPDSNPARLDPDPRIPTHDHNVAPLISKQPSKLCSKLTKLEIPTLQPDPETETDDGYETAEESFLTEEDFMVAKSNLSEEEDEIPKDKIMQRIDSHKGMRSYQLAQHLSTRWSTGAGPRIGCMRDYPTELQFRVLEQANLSPRAKGWVSSPRNPSRFFNQKGMMSQNSLGLD